MLLNDGLRVKDFKAGLVIWMSWDRSLDIDLNVREPNSTREVSAYKASKHGALVSQALRDTCGPQIYVLPEAVGGTYEVIASHSNLLPVYFSILTVQNDISHEFSHVIRILHQIIFILKIFN